VLRHACPLGQPHYGIGLPHVMAGPGRARPEDFHAHQ
jgi:hypothetical protein